MEADPLLRQTSGSSDSSEDVTEGARAASALAIGSLETSNEATGAQDFLTQIDFDLGRVGSTAVTENQNAALSVRKPVDLDGLYRGEARIYVFSDTLLGINREELAQLLVAAGKGALNLSAPTKDQSEAISFDDLRRLGIGIQYDPIGDRIIVQT